MTAQTLAFLKTSLLAANQSTTPISPTRMQDVPDTIGIRVLTYNVMAPEFAGGAPNAGATRPASGRFSSLGALQTAVGGTTLSGVTLALTQELDWIACQMAINAVSAAGGGGVYLPSGAGYYFSNSNSVSDGSGTLVFPVTTTFAYVGGVSLIGDFPGSVLHWPNDLGAGKGGLLCSGRANASSGGLFRGLVLVGPGIGGTFGSSSTSMAGIMTNDRRDIADVSINAFKYGIDITGGQCNFERVTANGCYYGYYWGALNSGNFGNMYFRRVLANNCLMAAIGISHPAKIINSSFYDCFLGTAPYCIFKETNGGSPSDPEALHGVDFHMCQFENFGNACVGDDTANASARWVIVWNSRFVQCQWMWDTYAGFNFHLPSGTAYAVFDCFTIDMDIDGIVQPEQLQPGTIGIFNALVLDHLTIRGDIDRLILNCTGAVGPKVNNMMAWGDAGTARGGWDEGRTLIHVEDNWGYYLWTGTMAVPTAAMAAGDFCVSVAGQPGHHVAQSAGTAAEVPYGVLMYNPTPGSSGGLGLAAHEGVVAVKSSGTIGAGALVRTGASGAVVAASGSNDTTSPIIGLAMTAAAGNVCTVKLRGLV